MIKRLAACWLPTGADGDEFWRYHTQQHGPEVVQLMGPALKHYSLSRVLKGVRGEKPNIFDFMETWWESEDAMNKAYANSANILLPNGKTLETDFGPRVAGMWTVLTEEYIVKE